MAVKDIKQTGPKALQGVRNADIYGSGVKNNPNSINTTDPDLIAAQKSLAETASADYRARTGNIGSFIWNDPNHDTIRRAGSKSELNTLGNSVWDDPVMVNANAGQIQDNRANRQPWYSKLVNGITKGVILTGTTFLDSTIGLATGIGMSIAKNDSSQLWDNPMSRALNDFNKWSEEVLPNYYSQAEQEAPWYTNIFTANFLADKFIKNWGFTIGSLFVGGWIAQGVRGIGMAAMRGLANAGRTAKAIRATKMATKISAGMLGAGVSAWNEGRIEGLNAANEATADMYRNLNAQKEEAIKNLKLRGIREYTPEWNQAMQQIDNAVAAGEQEIQRRRADVGNRTMIENIPLLMLDNILQFGRVFTKGFSGAVKADMMDARLRGGGLTRNAEGKWVGTTTHPKLKVLGKTLLRGALEGHEEIAQQGITDANKLYNYLVSDNYFKQQFDPQAKKETFDYWDTAMTAIKGTLQRGDTWEQGFIGGMTGVLGVPMRHTEIKDNQKVNKWTMEGGFFGSRREVNEAQAAEATAAEQLNNFEAKFKNDKNATARLKRLIAHNYYERQKQDALSKKDKLEYKNSEYQELLNAIMLYDSVGKINDFKDIIDAAVGEELSDEDYQSVLDSFTDKKTAQESLNKLQQQQAEQEKTLNDLKAALDPTEEPSEEDKQAIADATTELEATQEKITDIQNKIDNNIEKNPFVDNSGTPMSKEEMQEKLQRRKEDFFDTINDFVNVKAQIETFAGERLNDDQIGELTWLKMNQRDWANRFYELGDKLNPILDTIRQSKEDARDNIAKQADSLKEDIANLEQKENLTKEEKQNLTGLKNQLKMQQENLDKLNEDIANISVWQKGISSEQKEKTKGVLTSLTGATTLALLSMQSKTNEGKGVYQLAKILDDSLLSDTIDIDQIHEAVDYANDMYKLAFSINDFANKYRQYVLDPNKIISEQERAQQAANQQQAEVHRNELADKINWAGSLTDINNALSSADMQKAIEDAGGWDAFVSSLTEEQQQKVKDAQSHHKRLTAFLDSIEDSNLSDNQKLFLRDLIDSWGDLSVPEMTDKLKQLRESGEYDNIYNAWLIDQKTDEESIASADRADEDEASIDELINGEDAKWEETQEAAANAAEARAEDEEKNGGVDSKTAERLDASEENSTVLIPGSLVASKDEDKTKPFYIVTSLDPKTGELNAVQITFDKNGNQKNKVIKSTIAEFNKLIDEEKGTHAYSNEGAEKNLKAALGIAKESSKEKGEEKKGEGQNTGSSPAPTGTPTSGEGTGTGSSKGEQGASSTGTSPAAPASSPSEVKGKNKAEDSPSASKTDSSKDPNYGFRPYLSERFFSDTSLSLADVYAANKDLLPSEIPKEEQDIYIQYLRSVTALLKNNNSFYYIHNKLKPKDRIEVRALTPVEIGDDSVGRHIREYTKGKPLYGIFTEEGQLLGILPHENEYEYHTKYTDTNGKIKTSTETIANKFSALIKTIPEKGKKSLGTVNNLYGGSLPIAKVERSLYEALTVTNKEDEKLDIKLAVVQKGGKLVLSDPSIDPQSVLVNYNNITEGQVFVLVPTNKGTYLPALCYSKSIQELWKEHLKAPLRGLFDVHDPVWQFLNAAFPLSVIDTNTINATEILLNIKKTVNLPGLAVKIGTWKGKEFTEKPITEGGKVSISYLTSNGDRTSIILSPKQHERLYLRYGFSREDHEAFIEKILKDYPNLTFNVNINYLKDSSYRTQFLSQTLISNLEATTNPETGTKSFEAVNDWFTFIPDNLSTDRKSAKAKATRTNKLGTDTKATARTTPSSKSSTSSTKTSPSTTSSSKSTSSSKKETKKEDLSQGNLQQTGKAEVLDLGEKTAPSSPSTSSTSTSLEALAGFSSSLAGNTPPTRTTPARRRPGTIKKLDSSRTNETTILAKNEKEAINRVKKMFPQLEERDAIQIVHSLSNILNGNENASKVYGIYSKGLITLAENTVKGSVYHEAFHYAVDLLFTPEEKETFFNEAALRYGVSNKLELEEKASEEFREFMNGFTDTSLKGKVLRFFRKLKFMIKNLIGKNNYMDNLFYSMYNGQFADRAENNLTEESIKQYQQEHYEYVSQKLAYENLNLGEREMIDKRFSKEQYEALPNEAKEHTLMCAI